MNIHMNKIESDDLNAYKEFSASTRESAITFALAVRKRKALTKASAGGFWQTQADVPTQRTTII